MGNNFQHGNIFFPLVYQIEKNYNFHILAALNLVVTDVFVKKG